MESSAHCACSHSLPKFQHMVPFRSFYLAQSRQVSWRQHHDSSSFTNHHLSRLKSNSRDKLFPYSSPLWFRSDGSILNHSFSGFFNWLHLIFWLWCRWSFLTNWWYHRPLLGPFWRISSFTFIQAIGRWSSESFRIYVRMNPVLIQALLFC